MSKTLKTPDYWKDEEYQPLIEVKTINGNSVRIPERLKDSWDFLMTCFEPVILEQGKVAGLNTIKDLMEAESQMTSKKREDFYKVFVENYQG